MTRRDYVALAGALASVRPDPVVSEWNGTVNTFTDQIARERWTRTRDAIADVLRADNPRFDRERFNAATERVS